MICALLVFQTPELPDALSNISPWLDWLGTPRSDVYARLARQDHRRFIETHTPLDGLPVVEQVTYLVTKAVPWTSPCSSLSPRWKPQPGADA